MFDFNVISLNAGQLRMLIGLVTEHIHIQYNHDSAYDNDYLPNLVMLLHTLTVAYSEYLSDHATSKLREDSKDN